MIIQVYVNVKIIKKPLNERFQQLAGIKPLVKEATEGEELDVLGEVLSNLYGAVEVRESIMRGKSRTDALNNFMKKVTSIGK